MHKKYIKVAVLYVLYLSATSLVFATDLNITNIANKNSCNIPQNIPLPKKNKIDCINNAKTDYYMLALSWSPQFCYKNNNNSNNQMQCQDNKFNFIVHGLWPQKYGARGACDNPRNCVQSNVDINTIKNNLCIMPSSTLINQEWQKHGSCAFNSAQTYYEQIQKLWFALKKPDLISNNNDMTIGDIKQKFISLNPSLKKEGINITLDKKRYLSEVRICYNLNLQPTNCEKQGIPDFIKVKITQ